MDAKCVDDMAIIEGLLRPFPLKLHLVFSPPDKSVNKVVPKYQLRQRNYNKKGVFNNTTYYVAKNYTITTYLDPQYKDDVFNKVSRVQKVNSAIMEWASDTNDSPAIRQLSTIERKLLSNNDSTATVENDFSSFLNELICRNKKEFIANSEQKSIQKVRVQIQNFGNIRSGSGSKILRISGLGPGRGPAKWWDDFIKLGQQTMQQFVHKQSTLTTLTMSPFTKCEQSKPNWFIW
uniref:Uncharacterized protein n=1 Tax=Romanomermis culicivorax TaxID=13658 RepID=A0A915KD75_ROMCU